MKAGKIEIRGDREFSNGNFARFPIMHRFENGEVEGCKECNRQEGKFTNEGRGFENWKKVFDVLDKIFGQDFFFLCVCPLFF